VARLDERFDLGFLERAAYADERRRRMTELEALRAETDEPASLVARREELRTLVDDWDGAPVETRRALVASVFETLQPTKDGGMVARVRPGWVRHAVAVAKATSLNVCVYGADPGALTRDRQTAPSLLIAYDDGRLDAYLAA